MRGLIFGIFLVAVAALVFQASLTAASDTKAATFSERFAPVLKSTAS